MKNIISSSDIITIKIGSSLLIKNNKFNSRWLSSLISDIEFFQKKKKKIIIVASGAVTLGRNYLNIKENKNLKINEKQAFAACGQSILMNNFIRLFNLKQIKIAQILLTYTETENRKKSLNARDTIITLMKRNIIPIINENDSVAIDELKFGDNDRLAARVSQIVNANVLILFSDVGGLYDSNPKKNINAKLITLIKKIDKKIIKMAGFETNLYGTGGMKTKIQAAEIAMNSGCSTIICSGMKENPLINIFKNLGKHGTLFLANQNNETSYKKWLSSTIKVSGKIIIDEGAKNAIIKGASLLPSGVRSIFGKFFRGDIVEIKNKNNILIGKGLILYDHDEVKLIMGKKTSEIKKILGYIGKSELIHRDYLIMTNKGP